MKLVVCVQLDCGGFSAIALNLPGCASQGDTADEAIDNVREAAEGIIESYRDDKTEVPWLLKYETPRWTEIVEIDLDQYAQRPCVICGKELESVVDDWEQYQPHEGGEIQLIFAFGSCRDGDTYRGVICDDCGKKLALNMDLQS